MTTLVDTVGGTVVTTTATVTTATAATTTTTTRPSRRRNPRFDAASDARATLAALNNATTVDATNIPQLLTTINDNSSKISNFISNDQSRNKENSFIVLSKVSDTAKKMLDKIRTDQATIPLNVEDTVNLLKLMNKIYDNDLPITGLT